MTISELEEFQRRVEAYFNTGKPKEPAGRLILDLLRALKMCPVDNDGVKSDERK